MHTTFMTRAIDIAKLGFVSPNPRVGAVLVKNNKIIAEGYHNKFGGSHAEIELFNSLSNNFDYKDTTLYVSLEPCFHYGKTPPCVDAIIQKKVKTVVIACLDPNPLTSGKSVEKLQEAGIEVIVGVCEERSKILNESFFKFITTKIPYVVMKSGMSLDGKICTTTGESQWITSEESRLEVHTLRSELTAIMVGINTILQDDPLLTSRISNGRNPIRIMIDSKLRTPITSQLVQTANDIETIIVTSKEHKDRFDLYTNYNVKVLGVSLLNDKINLKELMVQLGKMNIDSILIEGGAELCFSALQENIVDKIYLYVAPILLGGSTSKSVIGGEGVLSLKDAFELSSYKIRQLHRDFVLEGYLKNKELVCSQEL